MTYRIGAYVVEQRQHVIGEILGTDDGTVRLAPVAGGPELRCPPDALRLATRAERLAAGLTTTAAVRHACR